MSRTENDEMVEALAFHTLYKALGDGNETLAITGLGTACAITGRSKTSCAVPK